MSENVQTGGVMSFNYKKDDRKEASERVKREIREAYEKAEERKEKEKKRQIIIWTIVLIAVIVLFGILIYYIK
jgi:uncharacterized membrane protein YvbJ